jgi:uncharacterized delta-60 repeat protein
MKTKLLVFFALFNVCFVNAQCWRSLTSGYSFTVALKNDGTIWAWGQNQVGQLGIGNTTDQPYPVQVGTDNNWKSISAGFYHAFAIKNDGTLWAWGYNVAGQLGLGNTTNVSVPTQVGTATNWAEISTDQAHTLARKTDGTIWSWGNNYDGQLGNGTVINSNTPAQIGTFAIWSKISAGNSTCYAITTDGRLFAWGTNSQGQLGVSKIMYSKKISPTQIGTANDWISVDGGDLFAMGLRQNPSDLSTMLFTWGSNWDGCIGNGGIGDYQDSPQHILPLESNWKKVCAGAAAFAQRTDGTIMSWGKNYHGTLGIGSYDYSYVPMSMGTESFTFFTTYAFTLLTLNDSGVLKVCGNNVYHQLGVDTTSNPNSLIPGPVLLTAVDDIGSAVAGIGGVAINVLANDLYDCNPVLEYNPIPINFQNATSTNPGITMNAAGQINVSSTVPPGTYQYTYQICGTITTPHCSTATATITVSSPVSLPPSVRANNFVNIIKMQSTNKIIIAGGFTAYNYQPVNRIARLNSDLTLDSFNTIGITGTGSYGVGAVEVLSNDYILVGGRFTNFNGGGANDIIKLNPNGNPDPTFSSGTGVALSWNVPNKMISAIAVQSDGRIIISGNFDSYNGQIRKGIARLYPNGTLDPSFNPGNGFLNQDGPCSIAIQPDGKIVVAGNFTSYQGQTRNKIVRILSDGNIDPSFVPTNSVSAGAIDDFNVLLQPNGGIIFYGKFTNYNGTGKNNIVRLKAIDGSVDTSFTGTGTTTNTKIWAAEIDPLTGHIYIGGGFVSMNGNTNNYYFGRFTSTGVVDNSFIGGYGPSYQIWSLKRQPDGKMILGGLNFNYYNTVAFSPAGNGNITRINPAYVGLQQRTVNDDAEIEKTSSSITIYPNPSEGIFNIDFKGYDEQKFDITVHNTLGQLIYQGVVTPENTNQIDLTRFESGSYFISLVNNKEIINKVVIKK